MSEEYQSCQNLYWNLSRWKRAEIHKDPGDYLSQYLQTNSPATGILI